MHIQEEKKMAQLDIDKYLSNKKGKKVNRFMYRIMKTFVAGSQAKPMNVEVVDTVGVKKIKGPFLLLSNHTSRCDWEYIGVAMGGGNPMNFVASNVEFHRAHMHGIFKIMNVIPKMNFVPDMHCAREIVEITKAGGSVILFPEGKSSISGTNQPVIPGTGSLVKKLGVPVYFTRISGGYMSNTQWNIANRPGKVVITVGKLFEPEQVKDLNEAEVERLINAAIYNDDFEWNKKMRVKYSGNENVAVKLEEHLFMCPKCGAEVKMKGEGNVIRCTACGNGAMIDEYYDLHKLDDTCIVPKNLRVWYELQRRSVYRQIKDNPDFCLQDHVTLGHQPTDHYVDKHVTSEIVGEGTLTLTRDEFSYVGTKDGEPFEIHKKTKNMISVVFETDSSNFGAFFDRKYYEFCPDRPSCTKWQIAVEEAHRLAGGVWQNTLPQQQWIYEDDRETDKEEYYL